MITSLTTPHCASFLHQNSQPGKCHSILRQEDWVHSTFITIKGSPPSAWHLEVFTSQGKVPPVRFKMGED